MKLIYDLRHSTAYLRICEKPATVETQGIEFRRQKTEDRRQKAARVTGVKSPHHTFRWVEARCCMSAPAAVKDGG